MTRAQFIKRFKEVQRLQTQLDQYTDLTDEQREQIEQALAKDDLRAFRGAYLRKPLSASKEQQLARCSERTAVRLNSEVDQLDSRVRPLPHSAVIADYDYIMKLIAKYIGSGPEETFTISREQLIGLIQSGRQEVSGRARRSPRTSAHTEGGRSTDEVAIRAGYEHQGRETDQRDQGRSSGPRV